MIISLHGIDSCGKGTQAEALRAHFAPLYHEVEVLHFPVYDSPTGRVIKHFLSCGNYVAEESVSDTTLDAYVRVDQQAQAIVLQSLMVTNRLEQLKKLTCYAQVAKTWTQEINELLILDRYNACAMAYGQADGLDPTWLKSIHMALPEPAHCFLLDIPVEESFQRRPKRTDAYESNRERLKKVQANYLTLAEGQSWHVLDGTRASEEITREIVEVIEPKRGHGTRR